MQGEGGVLVVAAEPSDRRAMVAIGTLALLVGAGQWAAFAWLAWTHALNLESWLYPLLGALLVAFGVGAMATRERAEIDPAAREVRFVVSTLGRRRVVRVPFADVRGVRLDVIGPRARVALVLAAEVRTIATEPAAEADRTARAISRALEPTR